MKKISQNLKKYSKQIIFLLVFLFVFNIGYENYWNVFATRKIHSQIFNAQEILPCNDKVYGSFEEHALKVHYIDVGQGDCIFIELPNQETVLIDAGTPKSKDKIIEYIKSLNYNKINHIIATHPHADHIGSMKAVLDNFFVENLYLPPIEAKTITYKKTIDTAKNKKITINYSAEQGLNILDYYNLSFDIISPVQNVEYSDLNNWSIVSYLKFGQSDFLFTGDAEQEAEEKILKEDINIETDVLKVGHHGSRTSSSVSFIERIKPKIAVISCGKNNKYKHPHVETLELFNLKKIQVLRTDILGDIIINSDSKEQFNIICEKENYLQIK